MCLCACILDEKVSSGAKLDTDMSVKLDFPLPSFKHPLALITSETSGRDHNTTFCVRGPFSHS